jgi:CHASE3 domain sensor protein
MKKQLRLIRKMQFGFAAVLTVFLILGIVSYRSLAASVESERWVRHTYEVLEHLQSLLSEITGTETRYRGLALNGNETFLQPSRSDGSPIGQEATTLRALTADNPYQQRQVDALASRTKQMVRLDDTLVRLRRARGPQAAAEVIRQGQGQQIVDAVRAITHDMQDEEHRLLLKRNEDAQRRFRETKVAMILGSVLGLLIAIVAGRVVQRDYAERGRAEVRYRGLLEAAPDAMVVVNQGGEIVLLNVQAEKQFGYHRDELVGQRVKNIIPEGFSRASRSATRTLPPSTRHIPAQSRSTA